MTIFDIVEDDWLVITRNEQVKEFPWWNSFVKSHPEADTLEFLSLVDIAELAVPETTMSEVNDLWQSWQQFQDSADLSTVIKILKGGRGSGNFGHGGRPGKKGGSSPGKFFGKGAITNEIKTPPPPGKPYNPNVRADKNKDGVTDSARVGVGGFDVPPPPPIGRLPNLTPRERKVESDFIKAYENNPDKMVNNFLELTRRSTKSGEPLTFGTDDAKVLSSVWSDDKLSLDERSQNRATLNLPLHQTANAIAKKSFVKHLDTLNPGDEIMVTVGGVGAGKGYALNNVPQALEMKKRSKAVWDSAGDQNATENPWVLEEAEKRGLKVNYVFVHADPKVSWADPGRGVVKRAGDPKDGRMVDAHVFGDSYAIGARNHQEFAERNSNNPNVVFEYLDNRGTPKRLDGIPTEAFNFNSNELTEFAINTVENADIPPHVRRGATIGDRIWGTQ